MTDGIMLSIGKDGIAREYDDTYDITIHCESREEQEEAIKAVVKVVRCKDCKYYTLKPQQTSRVTSVRRCNRSAIVCTKPDDFCSFGERIAK